MLSAYLYRIRKQALKKPIVLILGILAVAFCVLMLFFPYLLEEEIVRKTDLVVGGLNLLLIVIADFMFYSALKSGVVGYSNADVNFHLAGPFSEKFNLIIAASGIFKLAAIFLWVFCCQVAVLVNTFGVNTADMFGLVLSSGVVIIISYAIGAFFASKYDDNEAAKRKVFIAWIAINVLCVGGGLLTVLNEYGSVAAVKALGGKGIIAALGGTFALKAFPVAGWISLIYSGIILRDAMYIALGIVLTIASVALIVILFRNFEINYYETAIINAQKVADVAEARRAGIDSDTQKLNSKIKVGKETMKSGWGASAFFHRHLLENARGTKLFFINPLALLYRVIIFIYMLIMRSSADGPEMLMVMGITMIVILNSVVYSGGKTALEFNRPFIFMVPEPGWRKLLSCLSASAVEMVFDSLICVAIFKYFTDYGLVDALITFALLLVFDALCQLVSILELRFIRGLGRVLLMVVRYFILYAVIIVAAVPAIVVGFITSSLMAGLVTAMGVGVVLIIILLILSRNILDNVEFS